MPPTVPPRLHVLLASQSPRAVVLRRGPAGQVASILWDRTKDTFTLGQWLKGRIYEEKADISPDGRHWLYLALNGRWQSESRGSWIAVARVPYLKALAFYPQGSTYGGSLFVGQHAYYLTGGQEPGDRESPEVHRVTEWPASVPKLWPALYARMVRNGWSRIEEHPARAHKMVLERPAGAGWTLRYTSGWPRGAYELVRREERLPKSDWEWADLDGDRLVWAQGGQLWAGRTTRKGLHRIKALHDFRSMKFEAIEAPY